MKLNELFENVPDIEIDHLFSDSRKKRSNAVFFCIKGMMFDGHEFIDQAIENGAKVIVHSEDISNKKAGITYIKVKDVLGTYNKITDIFYGKPSKKLLMFGVTGTNGKSSTASMIRDIIDASTPCGYVGTIGIEYKDVKLPPLLTTPDIDDLHSILKDMLDAGMGACAMEASSMGIEQRRIDAIDFDVAIFTNLTHEHLDYHGSMQNYFLAKKKLFDDLKEEAIAIVNVDDPYGKKIVADTKATVVTYGMNHEADYQVVKYQLLKNKTKFTLDIRGMEHEIETNLVAKFNIYNLVAAIAGLHEKGLPMQDIIPCLNQITQIEGRMERIEEGQPFTLVVDYAHTPDGFEKICEYASSITPKDKRVIVLTGSAGRRDSEKRPVMGEILDKYCDMIILTEDDYRDEDPREIADEIAEGIENTTYVYIEDRYDAIRQAIEIADPNDFIMILGKGNDKYMATEFGKEPWDGDVDITKEILRKYYFANSEES